VIEPPNQLRTERLLLRLPSIDDAEAIFEEYAADKQVTRYLTWVPHERPETVAEFLADVIERRRAARESTWVLTLPPDTRPIGSLGARFRGYKVDIGYVLSRRHWGCGYMTEAVTGLTEWALAQPSIYRVWAVCDVENLGSARVLEKSGFEREGVLRRWIVHPNRSSKPRDCCVYARVRPASIESSQ